MSVSLSLESLPLSLLLLSRLSLSTTCLSPWCLSLEVQDEKAKQGFKGLPVSVEAMPQIRVIAATSAPPIAMVSLLPTVPSSSSVVTSPVLAVSFSARFFLAPPGRELRNNWPTFSFNEITFFSSHHGLPCDGLFSPPGASSASPRPSSPEEAG